MMREFNIPTPSISIISPINESIGSKLVDRLLTLAEKDGHGDRVQGSEQLALWDEVLPDFGKSMINDEIFEVIKIMWEGRKIR
jgi:hypothetical protein